MKNEMPEFQGFIKFQTDSDILTFYVVRCLISEVECTEVKTFGLPKSRFCVLHRNGHRKN